MEFGQQYFFNKLEIWPKYNLSSKKTEQKITILPQSACGSTTHLPHRRSYKLRKPAIDFSLSFSQKKRGFRLHLKTHKNHEKKILYSPSKMYDFTILKSSFAIYILRMGNENTEQGFQEFFFKGEIFAAVLKISVE